ncbi:MAG: U32 family peptidase [Eubacterium sp.]|nr:U32 family peptidase [Eubacterium sp.]
MSNTITRKPELLIPAGGLETLKVAVDYGADAVYIGGQRFGLRAKADNFSKEDMEEAVRYTHEHGVKLYVTTNIYAHNDDIEKAAPYYEELKNLGVDAVLISDPGLFSIARDILKGSKTEIHISTQANNTNYQTYKFWHDMGATRVVAARELSLKEIRDIRDRIPEDLEIEAFMHGAMCISYSGRCLLSNYFTGRDANKGACTHPCRWKYVVMEENRPGEYLPVEEDERGTYIFNSKDLCMVDKIPDLVNAGIDSFKVEGRMKTNLYVAVTASTYREAIDDYFTDSKLYESKIEHYKHEIAACTMRDFTRGFYYGKPSEEDQIYDNNTYVQNATYMGRIEKVFEDGSVGFSQKNKFSVGEELEIMIPGGTNQEVIVESILDEYGNEMESAPHPKQELRVYFKTNSYCKDKKEQNGVKTDLVNIKTGFVIRKIVKK